MKKISDACTSKNEIISIIDKLSEYNLHRLLLFAKGLLKNETNKSMPK